MILYSKPLAIIVVILMFGSIFFSSAMGWWQTETTKEAAVFTSGEFSGQANPADIRGSYTFGDVERNFDIPASLLVEAFAVETGDPAAYQVKGLEEMYAGSAQEIGTASVRLFVAFYKGLPFDLSTDTYLPQTAAQILQKQDLSSEQAAYLEAHTLSQDAQVAPEAPASISTPLPDSSSAPEVVCTQTTSEERLVKGKTSFSDLLVWGLSKETIEEILGMPMPETACQLVKDFSAANGLDFETIRPALQTAVDAAK